ncbi:hypothetical protein C064_01805 [Brucella suis 63/252]|nr:hypothetical protein C064_01805 [Brucella suis 63/252]ENS47350.1 hypothetical protein B976_01539 [Brucella canis 79/122]ENT28536.1 hypothetical protein C037_01802 [Brucella suis 63/198]ERU10386.1 hypothetical protein P036_01906 [Brucella canis 04-2330-1]
MQGRLSVGELIEQLWARVNVDSAAQANEKAAIAALQHRFWRQTCFWRAKHEALPAKTINDSGTLPAVDAHPIRKPFHAGGKRPDISVLQRFLKEGVRLSTKADMPSFWSSVAKSEWNRRRSKRRPSSSVVS